MYNGTKVLDLHAHVSMPTSVTAYLATLLAFNTGTRNPLTAAGPATSPSPEDTLAAAVRHVAYIDERQIDVQVIGPRPYLMLGWMPPHLLHYWTQVVNDAIAAQVSCYPDRFLGACQLPINSDAPDTGHVLPELDRCVNDLGFVAAYLAPDPKGQRTTPGVDAAFWYPLYARCQELNVPLIVHGTNCMDPRLEPLYGNNQIGFAIEQFLATHLFSRTDVFDRFPQLRVMICHCGGALDRFIKSDPHVSQRDLRDNLFFDTCAHDLDYLTAAIRQRTVPQTVFGTEAPGSGAAVRPAEEPGKTGDDLVPVISSFGWLSEEDRLDIFHRNPIRVVPQLGAM